MRRLIGNWKMQGSLSLCQDFLEGLKQQPKVEITLCPPSLYAQFMVEKAHNFSIGLQDISSYEEGPHTGEISAKMLRDLQINYAIIGHSERGELPAFVLNKLQRLLSEKITPILCLASLEAYEFFLPFLTPEVILAYEPPSAIGTGILPQISDLERVLKVMKTSPCSLLYGGSVQQHNLKELFLSLPLNGFLVGGASLKLESFNTMAQILSNLS